MLSLQHHNSQVCALLWQVKIYAEEFAQEEETDRKCIEALNSLSSFVYRLDKKTVLAVIKEAMEQIEDGRYG